ncbi:MAG TPA: four helix bundle protein [Candidatus Saccharimonadales bacterium]|nr:four helix bundle protein [Candidatus Saccharimonadales bacterium]
MTKSMILGDDPIWEKTAAVAEYAYGLLDSLPEEEAWGIASTLRRVSFAATDDIAEAAGSHDPRDRMHHYGHARREIFGLKNALVMARRLAGVDVDPEILLCVDEILEAVDHQFADAQKHIQPYLSQYETHDKSETKK